MLCIDTVADQAKPVTGKLGGYAHHVLEIANETAAEFSPIAEKQMSEASPGVFATIDEISKGAPAGTEVLAGTLHALLALESAG
jgi:hypothetical protein